MAYTESRGRPSLNIEKILKYTQTFNNQDGTKSIWVWDKIINPNGPLSVTIEYPNTKEITKLEKEKFDIEKKYIKQPGERKPRILKVDKERLETINELIQKEYAKIEKTQV